jgi:structural maintenance of chromosomes protein 5
MVTQYETADATFRQRLEKWQSSVTEIARRLHSYFSKYMSELQYRGSVELVQQGSLKDYEMQMYVSFRDNMDEHKLSGQRHSGGERAVSTIMYLMALQELTTAPFRVVDEINQVHLLSLRSPFLLLTCSLSLLSGDG